MSEFAVILVHSTSHAVYAERVLGQAGLVVKLVPTPRHLSSDCGSAVRIVGVDKDRAESVLAESRVPIDRVEPWD